MEAESQSRHCRMTRPSLSNDRYSTKLHCPDPVTSAILCQESACFSIPKAQLGEPITFKAKLKTRMTLLCLEGEELLTRCTGKIIEFSPKHHPNWVVLDFKKRNATIESFSKIMAEILKPSFASENMRIEAMQAICKKYPRDSCDSYSLCLDYGHALSFADRNQTELGHVLQHVFQSEVDGDIVEVGTWRGGIAAYIALFMQHFEVHNRHVYALDSFEGHPNLDGELQIYSGNICSFLHADFEHVKSMLVRLKVDENVTALKGWIQDTIPTLPVDAISVLLVDVDSYDAIKYALESLFSRVPLGGAIVIDDYNHYQQARDAVHDFLWENNIDASLRTSSPYARVIWMKTDTGSL